MATDLGFELVTVFRGAYGDKPIWALMRDGQISPTGRVDQAIAFAASQAHFEFANKLPAGTLVYRRKRPPATNNTQGAR